MDPEIVNHRRYGGNRLKDALKAIPSISVTTDLANLFDPVDRHLRQLRAGGPGVGAPGLRRADQPRRLPGVPDRRRAAHPRRLQPQRERTRSMPSASSSATSTGRRTWTSRSSAQEGAGSFEKVDLRTAQNHSWSYEGSPGTTTSWPRSSRATPCGPWASPTPGAGYYHLYLNGQYWGLYQTEERPEADFGATYLGGDPDDYDVIRPETALEIEATDGDLDAWRRLWQGATVPGAWRRTPRTTGSRARTPTAPTTRITRCSSTSTT